ncbi:MAG: hypothetical protein ACRDFC_05115 [Ignavibacteria bacterium]
MQKIKTAQTILFSLLIILCNTSINAQEIRVDTITLTKTRTIRIATVRSVPTFIIQLSGGYNSGALELSQHNGEFSKSDFIAGKSYGARMGYGVSLTGKIRLHKKGIFWLDVITSYNRFQSGNTADSGKISYNVFSGGLGAEINFTSYHRVKYFVGANVLYSAISGEAELVRPFENIDIELLNVKIKSANRIGYSVFIGLDYAFTNNFGFNLGYKFTHANLLLKNSTPVTRNSETEINDDSTEPRQLYTGWKQFAYSSLFAGISYYFGVKEGRYKLP